MISRRAGAAVTVALALLLAVLVPWQQLASAGSSDGGSVAAAPSTDGSRAKGETPGSARTTRASAREAPTELARELTDLRQRLVVDLDKEVLSQLDEPNSPAAARDAQLVDQLRSSGQRYRGITMTVRSAQLQRTTGRTAVLRTTVDESGYAVVGPDGVRQRRPARRGQQVDLVLAWDGGAWRVRDVAGAT